MTIIGGKKINSKRKRAFTLQKRNEYALHDFGELLKSVITEYDEHKRQKGSPNRRRVLHPLYRHLNGDRYVSDRYISKVSKMCTKNNINIKDFTFAETLELNQFMFFSPILIKLKQPNVNNKGCLHFNHYGQSFIFAKALADTGRVKEDFISVLADFNRTDRLSIVLDGEKENTYMDNLIHFIAEEKFDNSIPVTFLYNLYGLENCKVRKTGAAESSISDIVELVKFYKYTTQKR